MQLPTEDIGPGEEQMCGRLQFSMYGTRDAAQNWHQEYSQQFFDAGLQRGLASLCIFHHPHKGIRTYVHGDEYVSTGMPDALQWMREKLEGKYHVKTQMLGPGKDQCRQIKVLNRVITWHGERGLAYEADPRHVELVVQQFGLQDSKLITTPGTREEGNTKDEHVEMLNGNDATKYRAVIARCNHLAPDRPDVAYVVKEFARAMAKLTQGDMQRLKRLGRYLEHKPRLQQWYAWQLPRTTMRTYSDADWAGCRETRKSTTGGCVMIGSHNVKS